MKFDHFWYILIHFDNFSTFRSFLIHFDRNWYKFSLETQNFVRGKKCGKIVYQKIITNDQKWSIPQTPKLIIFDHFLIILHFFQKNGLNKICYQKVPKNDLIQNDHKMILFDHQPIPMRGENDLNHIKKWSKTIKTDQKLSK